MAALAQWTNLGMIDNSVNEMEVHIQQTNDRLQCIRQVQKANENHLMYLIYKQNCARLLQATDGIIHSSSLFYMYM